MTITGATKKLQANGWQVRESATSNSIVAFKTGKRDIRIMRNGIGSNDVAVVAIQIHFTADQPDASSDFRYCDTIKEAMAAA